MPTIWRVGSFAEVELMADLVFHPGQPLAPNGAHSAAPWVANRPGPFVHEGSPYGSPSGSW
eukprot:6059490-Pyramimonas_sp.AAC.1